MANDITTVCHNALSCEMVKCWIWWTEQTDGWSQATILLCYSTRIHILCFTIHSHLYTYTRTSFLTTRKPEELDLHTFSTKNKCTDVTLHKATYVWSIWTKWMYVKMCCCHLFIECESIPFIRYYGTRNIYTLYYLYADQISMLTVTNLLVPIRYYWWRLL